jgi:hypothetical protein
LAVRALNAARSFTGGSKWRKEDANKKDQKHLQSQKEIEIPKPKVCTNVKQNKTSNSSDSECINL